MDRFAGMMEISLDDFARRRDDFSDELWIPWHRVHWFKRAGELVWDRGSRLDRVFRSKDVDNEMATLHESSARADADCNQRDESRFTAELREHLELLRQQLTATMESSMQASEKTLFDAHKDFAKQTVSRAMLGFRQVATEIRDYYACEVGGLQRQSTKLLRPAELHKFLADVQPGNPGNSELAKALATRLKDDKQPWTWEELCKFCEFSNKFAHPDAKDTMDSRAMQAFMVDPALIIPKVQASHTFNNNSVKALVPKLLISYADLGL